MRSRQISGLFIELWKRCRPKMQMCSYSRSARRRSSPLAHFGMRLPSTLLGGSILLVRLCSWIAACPGRVPTGTHPYRAGSGLPSEPNLGQLADFDLRVQAARASAVAGHSWWATSLTRWPWIVQASGEYGSLHAPPRSDCEPDALATIQQHSAPLSPNGVHAGFGMDSSGFPGHIGGQQRLLLHVCRLCSCFRHIRQESHFDAAVLFPAFGGRVGRYFLVLANAD